MVKTKFKPGKHLIHQCSLTTKSCISLLTENQFIFNFSITVDTYCIGFRCTVQWLDIYITYVVIPSHNANTHLAPYIVITILLTIFPMLYFISQRLFCNCYFVFLILSNFFTQPSNPPPISQLLVCSLCLLVFLVYFLFLDSTYK